MNNGRSKRPRGGESPAWRRLAADEIPWSQLDDFPDRTIFQTRAWVEFVARTQHAEPVVAVLEEGRNALGYFTGLITRKFGLRVLGSPFPGWTTSYMGFNLLDGRWRRAAAAALPRFAFSELGCVHLELMDRRLGPADLDGLGFDHNLFHSFEIDLEQTEPELFAAMTSACRRCIRKAEKGGVVIEEASDPEFADDYSAQLRDVFAKQSLVPTYGIERVQTLLASVYPTGRLLLLRARDPAGRCIATAIFPAFNDTMYFWGGASWRTDQHLRPNEAIQWYAMRYWKERGIARYDMGGGGDYKRKYGCQEITTPFFRTSRYPLLGGLRAGAAMATQGKQHLVGGLKALPAHALRLRARSGRSDDSAVTAGDDHQ